MDALQACLARVESGAAPVDAVRACPDPSLRSRLAELVAPAAALRDDGALPEARRVAMRDALIGLAAAHYPPAPSPSPLGPEGGGSAGSSPAAGGTALAARMTGIVLIAGVGVALLAAYLRPAPTEGVPPGAGGAAPAPPAPGRAHAVTAAIDDGAADATAAGVDARGILAADGGPSGASTGGAADPSDPASRPNGQSTARPGATLRRSTGDKAVADPTGARIGGTTPEASAPIADRIRPSRSAAPPTAAARSRSGAAARPAAYPTCLAAPLAHLNTAANGRRAVGGRVVDALCEPVAGLIVAFTSVDGTVEILARTEQDGTFAMSVDPGAYRAALDAGSGNGATVGAWVDGTWRPFDTSDGTVAVAVAAEPARAPRVDFMLQTGGAP